MQKTAKNISLSIAGVMVAVPAGADIASIDYVQRWVQNQSPIPAGSVISGYASGPYGSYLLAGTTVGGPYNAVSISDIGSKMSPYIDVKSLGNGYSGNDGVLTAGGWNSYSYFGTQLASASATGMGSILGTVIGSYIRGSQITGYGVSTGDERYVMVSGSTGGAPTYQSVSDFVKNSMAPYAHIFAMPGYSGGFVNTYINSYGAYIGGYQSGGSATITKILGFTGTGSSNGYETAKWFYVSGLGSYIKGSQITGYAGGSSVSYFLAGSGTGAASWVGASTVAATLGSMIGSYIPGSHITGVGVPGYTIYNYNFSGVATGSSAYILAGSSTGGAASWMNISGDSGRGLTDHLFSGYASGVPNYILGSSTGGTGNVPGYYSVSKMGTVIGTVSGNQVKFTQTATAETLQANTGTIYFPVVQNGKIYGVTLNDFYILMNAQF